MAIEKLVAMRGVLIVLYDFQNSVFAWLMDPEMKVTSPAALKGWKNHLYLIGGSRDRVCH